MLNVEILFKLDILRSKSSICIYMITLRTKITAYKCKIIINAVFILLFCVIIIMLLHNKDYFILK